MNYSNKNNTNPLVPTGRFSLLLLLLLVTAGLRATDPYTKTIDRSFAAVSEVTYTQNNGRLEVLPATDGKIRFVAYISIDAGEAEEARRFLDKMDLLSTESSVSLKLRLDLDEVTSWTTTGNRSLIKFGNGEKVRGVRNFDVRSILYLPPTQLLELSIRFSDIDIDSRVMLKDLTLELSNADLRGGTVKGNLEVDARFGSIVLESAIGRITGKLANNRLELTRGGGELDLNTRFSELDFGPMNSITLVSANDKVTIEAVTGRLKLDERFGQYRLGTTGKVDIVSSNGDYTVEKGGTYTVNGRFTTIEFREVTTLILDGNANCNYRADQLTDVRGEGRFTDIKVYRFTGRAELELTNGKFRVDQLAPSFTGIRVDGRFHELDIRSAGATVYQAKAKMTFGKFDVPEGLTLRVDKQSGSEIEKHFLTKDATESSPVIEVTGTNGSLRIN